LIAVPRLTDPCPCPFPSPLKILIGVRTSLPNESFKGAAIIALKGKPNSDKSGITFQFPANTRALARWLQQHNQSMAIV